MAPTQQSRLKDNMERRISQLVRMLPPVDENVDALLAAAAGGRSDRAELETLIAGDSGLCATLMLIAHGPCYAGRRRRPPLRSIREALDCVSPAALATLIGTSYAFHNVRQQLDPPPGLWTPYVRHSREISSICAILTGLMDLPRSAREMHTLAGLMHDIGRVVMMVAAKGRTASLIGASPDRMTAIVASEQAAYGMDHCRIGYELFRKWGMAESLQEGILRHHSPLIHHDFSYPGAIIFVSHFVTLSDFTGEIIAGLLPTDILPKLNLKPSDLDAARKMKDEAP